MAKDMMAKLRDRSLEELKKEEAELREEIWKLRLQAATGQLQDPYRVRAKRRDLARVLTVQQQLERAGAEGESR